MQLSDVNLTDPDIFQRGTPHEMFKLLRREAPVYWHEDPHGPGFWAITKYDDLKHVSTNPGLFSSHRQGTLLRDPTPETLPFVQAIMLNMDPPKHRQYRALVNKGFTPRMINGLHGRVRDMVTKIIDGVIEKGECDFVEEVAARLPMEVICEMMGVPEEDRRRVYEIGNQMVGFDDPELQADGKPRDMDEGEAAAAEMFVYAEKLYAKAVEHPSDDLATALVNAELDGEKLSPADFNFFFLLLLIAGNETTRTVTTNGMHSLIQHPTQLRDLRNDPSLLNGAIEEILRFAPAVHTFRRTATTATELRGQKIRESDKLLMLVPVRQPRRGRVRRARHLRHPPQPQRARRLRRRRALLSGRQPGPHGAARDLPRHHPAHARHRADRRAAPAALDVHQRSEGDAHPLPAGAGRGVSSLRSFC